MLREYHRWFSHHLGHDMELLLFGHAGVPMLVFPTSMGAFHEYEDRGMVAALTHKLYAGELQLFCVASVDRESWYNRGAPPRHRVERHLEYEQYLLNDVVPFVNRCNPQGRLGVTGCSFGAYHAMTFALRHPDLVASCITMGGAYDIHRFLDGYYDEDCYFLCPPDFLPNLEDPWFLERCRAHKWVLVTGEHDICRAENERLAHLFSVKRVPHCLHTWADTWHDWPWWQKMAQAYLP
jgi:esterase/lipase superfamily enzyme